MIVDGRRGALQPGPGPQPAAAGPGAGRRAAQGRGRPGRGAPRRPEAGRHLAVDAHLAHAQATLDEAKDDLDALSDEPAGTGWRARLALLPWKRIALVAAGLFALAVVAITAFELVVGRSVS